MARRALTLGVLAAAVVLHAAAPLASGTCAMGAEGMACCCAPAPGAAECSPEDRPGCCDVVPGSSGTTPAAETPRGSDHGAAMIAPASRVAAHAIAAVPAPAPGPPPPAAGPPRYLLLQTFLI